MSEHECGCESCIIDWLDQSLPAQRKLIYNSRGRAYQVNVRHVPSQDVDREVIDDE